MTVTSPTADVLKEMLHENTGRALMDSGDAYGRHWERNQGVDFDEQEEAILDEHGDLTINVYPWLVNRLTYEPDLTEEFRLFAGEDAWNIGFMEDFAKARCGGHGEWGVVNTYNGEDALSQTLQYVWWHDAATGQEMYLLQIHGGCDVRGGYTEPRVFSAASYDSYVLMDNARASISCDNGHAFDTTDAGYSWEQCFEADESMADLGEVHLEDNKCPVCGEKLTAYTIS